MQNTLIHEVILPYIYGHFRLNEAHLKYQQGFQTAEFPKPLVSWG